MRIIRSENEFAGKASVVALGMFDGVHIGHQHLIRTAVALARELDIECIVSTFDRHPMSVLCPEHAPRQLLTLEENIEKFRRLGADYVYVQTFTREFAQILPETFIAGLVEKLRARAIVSGENYSFGRKGEGNAELLKELAPKYGYRACIVNSVTEQGRPMSSTYIRSLIDAGDEAYAERLLRLRDL